MFVLALYFEVITDSQESTQKYTRRSHAPFIQPLPTSASYTTVVRYQNEDTDVDTTEKLLQVSPAIQAPIWVCACSSVQFCHVLPCVTTSTVKMLCHHCNTSQSFGFESRPSLMRNTAPILLLLLPPIHGTTIIL